MTDKEPFNQQQTETSVIHNDRQTTINTSHGIFSFYYGDHLHPDNRVNDIKQGDYIFLETGGINQNYVQDSFSVMLRLKQLKYSGKQQFIPILEKSANEHLPVILADSTFSKDPVIMNLPISIGETAIGAALLYKLNSLRDTTQKNISSSPEQNINTRKISRRGFLRAVASFGAAYMLSPTISDTLSVASSLTQVGTDLADSINKTVSTIHPERDLLSITTRNVILAHKQDWFAKNLGNKPHFHTFIGSGHEAIDRVIQENPDQRIAFLNSIKSIVNSFVVPETVYSLVKMENKVGHWQETAKYEVPELKALTQ